MVALISFLLNVVASLFKSKSRLEAENAALRHQLIVLQRKVRGRVHGPQGRYDHPTGDYCALASCRFLACTRFRSRLAPRELVWINVTAHPTGRVGRAANCWSIPLS